MTEIELSSDRLTVHIEGFDRILALKSQVSVPLSHVVNVEINPGAVHIWNGLKLPGTSIPGVIVAGSFLQAEGWAFLDVHDINKAVTINLSDEHYKKLVVEVADPLATVAAITQAIGDFK